MRRFLDFALRAAAWIAMAFTGLSGLSLAGHWLGNEFLMLRSIGWPSPGGAMEPPWARVLPALELGGYGVAMIAVAFSANRELWRWLKHRETTRPGELERLAWVVAAGLVILVVAVLVHVLLHAPWPRAR